MSWKLKRTNQCAKCPWRTDVDPNEIPGGYDVELHRALVRTIAGSPTFQPDRAMACHESPVGDEVHCVGWLVNQIGPGNNIPLRIQMMSCENARHIRTHGEQHERFEDTYP